MVKINDIKAQIESIKDKCGTCPILNESCDRIKVSPKELPDLKRQLKAAKREEENLLALEDKAEEWSESFQNLMDRLARAQSFTFETGDIQRDLKASKANLKVLTRLVESFDHEKHNKMHQKYLKISKRLDEIEQSRSEILTSIGQFKSQKADQKKRNKKIKELKEKIVKKDKRLTHLKYIAYMFSKRGIPSLEVENGFSEISDEMNFVLDKLQTSFQVQFQAQRELDKWEMECLNCNFQYPKGTRKHVCSKCNTPRAKIRKEEFKINVMKGEREGGHNMESGAGKALFSIAFRVALSLLKRRKKGSRFSVLFLDEPDGPFDKVNKAAFVQLVTRTLYKDLGFSQIFWISHSPDIQGLIPDILLVTKYKTWSKAKWIT